ncbi:MAG TPA: hypothetical protein VEC99_06625, partial [Clostridia bacterium]|nr:hypothetical protein [Clostridia bacterium]
MDASIEQPPKAQSSQQASFFRQSGWLMIANLACGMLMWSVHFLVKFLHNPGEYTNFGVFLTVIMLVPTIPLQMVLAQQTAKALACYGERQLSGLIRTIFVITSLVWLVGAVLVLVLQESILERWQMTSPVGLWVTLPIVLFSLWMPILWGVLQGQQNFLWLGWSMISNAVGRVTVAAVAVIALGAGAGGMMC